VRAINEINEGIDTGWADTRTVQVLRQLAAGAALREDPEALIQRVFLAVAEAMDLDFFIHYRYAGSGEQMDLASTVGVAPADLPALDTMVLGEAVCGLVAQTRASMAYSDVDRSEEERLELAAALGARTYASFPLLDGSELLGTLSFGSRTRSSLSTTELDVLQLATDILAAAVAHQRDHAALDRARSDLVAMTGTIKQMTSALASRDQIAQVKGMLMLRLLVSEEAAWQLLVRLSQTTNRKVRDVAADLAQHLLHRQPLPEDLLAKVPGGLAQQHAPGTHDTAAGSGA
jgi:GAF domain-containing protein